MKRFFKTLLLLALIAGFGAGTRAQSVTNIATIKSDLIWPAFPEGDGIDYYNVYLSGPRTNSVIQVKAPPVSITNLVQNAVNGVYVIYITAVNLSGLEGDLNSPTYFFWYGQPRVVTETAVSFTRVPAGEVKTK